MISVIIPAHDESAVIERCLRSLCEGAPEGSLEVLVVCNGCSDDTAERAAAVPGPIRVIDSPVPSKVEAMNLGDREVSGFPRFYLDADVVLSWDGLQKVADALGSGGVLAASPRPEIDLSRSSWPVRAFYEIWTRTPYFDDSLVGAGVFALSEAGRARFERFPTTMADDEYVRRLFAPEERRCVDEARFTITAPTRLGVLLAIKARSRTGRLELREQFPELEHRGSHSTSARLGLLLRPWLWPHLAVYAFVVVATRLRARRRFAARQLGWVRDETSRTTS